MSAQRLFDNDEPEKVHPAEFETSPFEPETPFERVPNELIGDDEAPPAREEEPV